MAALTQDRPTVYREGVEMDYPVAASTKIFAGALVCVNTNGYVAPAADQANMVFVGVALEFVDNSTGVDAGKLVRVRRTGVFEFDAVSITPAMVGAPMYCVDDHTFDDAVGTTNTVKVGVLTKYVAATKGWIDISR